MSVICFHINHNEFVRAIFYLFNPKGGMFNEHYQFIISYHNVTMNEAASQTRWPQVWIFFGTRDLDIPYPLPCLV